MEETDQLEEALMAEREVREAMLTQLCKEELSVPRAEMVTDLLEVQRRTL